MKKVLVVCGGFSNERDVSLVSGQKVAQTLKKCGYQVVLHDLTSSDQLLRVLESEKPDVVFNALHGSWGEDGTIQSFLDLLQIPYTHSGREASFIGMNKVLTKYICLENNIKTPPFETMTFAEFKQKGSSFPFPYVVKPTNDGSSIGVFIVRSQEDVQKVVYQDENRLLMIEPYIPGIEITTAVINDHACGVTELEPVEGFYDYTAKYTNGKTRHILPARIPEEAKQKAMHDAEKLHRLIGCRFISRSDFRYNENDGVVLLEINTNPGLTPLSLVPEQAKYIGLSYEELCSQLVENAQCCKIASL